MAKTVKLHGIQEVNARLDRAIDGIKNRSRRGLLNAAILIQRDMDKTPPLVPVDVRNLQQSWFATSMYYIGNPVVVLGFTANYAAWVHELTDDKAKGGKVNWSRPGSGPKFFEKALERNHAAILKEIHDEAKIR